MHKYIAWLLCIFVSVATSAQQLALSRPADLPLPSVIYKNFHGLSNGAYTIFEGEGYTVFIIQKEKLRTDKDMEKEFKKMGKDAVELPNTNTMLPEGTRVFRLIETQQDTISMKQLFYFVPSVTEGKLMIGLLTANAKRDTVLEKNVTASIYYDGVYNVRVTPNTATEMDFAGRTILLRPACRWRSPHTVQCGSGEMNWSVHQTYEAAKYLTDIQLTAIRDTKRFKLLKEEDINVTFEGTATTAKRVTYKINISKLLTGGDNVLIAYYVTAKVRDQFVHCVMSHYQNDVGPNGELPRLLAEVMKVN